jgi:hypothetical protein
MESDSLYTMRWTLILLALLLLAGCAKTQTYSQSMLQYTIPDSYSVTQVERAIKVTGQDTNNEFRQEVNFTVENERVIEITNASAGALTMTNLKKLLPTITFDQEGIPIEDGACFIHDQAGSSQSLVCFHGRTPFFFDTIEVTGALQAKEFTWKTGPLDLEGCRDLVCVAFKKALMDDPDVCDSLKQHRTVCEQYMQ